MSDVTAALSFRGLNLAFGRKPLFESFDLDINAGALTGIVGPNGCGKSTLLRLADGLTSPDAGEVYVGGTPVQALSARERARRVALLPQVHRTPSTTVGKLVACGRYAHMGAFGHMGPADEAAVNEALELMGLKDLATRPARALSGGERQRAFVAMVLAQQAATMMLDEPTTYLDVRAAVELMELVRALSERGTTVVSVIHDLDLALRTCDEIVVLGGTPTQLLAQGCPDEVAGSGALARAFGVEVFASDTPCGRAYSFFAT